HECGFGKRIGRAVGEDDLRRAKLGDRMAHMVKDRHKLGRTWHRQCLNAGLARMGHERRSFSIRQVNMTDIAGYAKALRKRRPAFRLPPAPSPRLSSLATMQFPRPTARPKAEERLLESAIPHPPLLTLPAREHAHSAADCCPAQRSAAESSAGLASTQAAPA